MTAMRPPSTYSALEATLTRVFPDLSNQLQRIARFALENPDHMALGTVASVAESTEVQPSAMIRFANALGYGGFSEMQQVFRSRLVERSASYRERIARMRRQQVDGTPIREGVLHQLVGEAMGELGHLEEHVPAASFDAAVRMLSSASRIHVLAQRRAFPVACYVAYALNQLELRTHLLDGAGGMLDANLRAIGDDDVLVAASFRNYSPDVIKAATDCHTRGIRVVAITDGPLSPLKQVADICFDLGDDSSRPFRSLVAPLCLAQALVVSTGHYLADKPPRKTARNNRKAHKESRR
jgi:DNA-binding MurR/RpiR family transcriptional regulator